MKLVIISGLSGSGKSIALHMLEDIGYYCVDNVPAGLLKNFAHETLLTHDPIYHTMAVGVDARNRGEDIAAVPGTVAELRAAGVECEIVFLIAEENALLKRYSETRRRHPLATSKVSLREAIRAERVLLEPLAEHADLTLDTSRTSVHDLRSLVRERIDRRAIKTLSLLFQSFAYRHGLPGDADYIFDARCLPNPYWEPRLRALSGREAPVIKYLEKHTEVHEMLDDLRRFLDRWIPRFETNNRSYMTVAVGCTGGYHRSVYITEKLAEHFRDRHENLLVRHNELIGV